MLNYPSAAARKRIIAVLLLALLFISKMATAHTVNLALEQAPAHNVVWFYLKLGIAHIVPYGIDHILFVVALCLLNTKLRTILWQATAFTVAHSITLALSMKGVVTLPPEVVEPLIALSIVFVAVENILMNELKIWRVFVVFLFGLIHGLGFAAALNEIGLPRNRFFTSIISFNAGVEIGQILVILCTFLLLLFPLGRKHWYKKRVVFPISILIALIAAFWTVQRLLA
jgi:hypothetical protein